LFDDGNSKEIEERVKKYALSKKSNQKIYNEENIFNIDKIALVSA
jgi:hypothetical protein